MAEEGVITNFDKTDTDETDLTDWDKDENFDFFAYIAFSEESKKPTESKKPVESENIRENELAMTHESKKPVRRLGGPLCVFW